MLPDQVPLLLSVSHSGTTWCFLNICCWFTCINICNKPVAHLYFLCMANKLGFECFLLNNGNLFCASRSRRWCWLWATTWGPVVMLVLGGPASAARSRSFRQKPLTLWLEPPAGSLTCWPAKTSVSLKAFYPASRRCGVSVNFLNLVFSLLKSLLTGCCRVLFRVVTWRPCRHCCHDDIHACQLTLGHPGVVALRPVFCWLSFHNNMDLKAWSYIHGSEHSTRPGTTF